MLFSVREPADPITLFRPRVCASGIVLMQASVCQEVGRVTVTGSSPLRTCSFKSGFSSSWEIEFPPGGLTHVINNIKAQGCPACHP